MEVKISLSQVLLEVGKEYVMRTFVKNTSTINGVPASAVFDFSWRILLDGLDIPFGRAIGYYLEAGEEKEILPRRLFSPLPEWAGKGGVIYVEVIAEGKVIADGYEEIYVLPIVPI